MSLPPERLRVKRKRHDDPVDALYLQGSEHSSKRRVTGVFAQEYVFRRLREEEEDKLSPSGGQSNAGTPQIIATQPGEENGFFERRNPARHADRSSSAPQRNVAAKGIARQFRLSKTTLLSPPSPITGKRHRGLEQNVAVLVEHHSPGSDAWNGSASREGDDASDYQPPAPETSEPPRKRPSGSARVRHRHVEKDTTQGSSETASNDAKHNYQIQSELRDAMQKFAMEHVESDEKVGKVHPNPLHNQAGDEDSDMLDADDYVYDTYVRYPVASSSAVRGETLVAAITNVGYIMLEEGDEEWWEKYADDMDSSDDWDSEQDDENAENYYGADYPEDELASDDEQGLNPYQYRNRGISDEEEFDSDWDDLSSNAFEDRYPWRSRPIMTTKSDAHGNDCD